MLKGVFVRDEKGKVLARSSSVYHLIERAMDDMSTKIKNHVLWSVAVQSVDSWLVRSQLTYSASARRMRVEGRPRSLNQQLDRLSLAVSSR